MYHPLAIVRDLNNKKNFTLYTKNGLLTIEDAKKVIEEWKENNEIDLLFEYIIDDNNIVYYKNNIDVLEHVDYKKKRKESCLSTESSSCEDSGRELQ